ncbi:hypothetical protein B0H14DRAFT_459648 [Mycena olivaceomarginata]|nr:hypothetical protein B0H14DRAFT_459648 [Mycena olivaceomarginata]
MRTSSVIPNASGNDILRLRRLRGLPAQSDHPPEKSAYTLDTAAAVLSGTCSTTRRASTLPSFTAARRASLPRAPRLCLVPLQPLAEVLTAHVCCVAFGLRDTIPLHSTTRVRSTRTWRSSFPAPRRSSLHPAPFATRPHCAASHVCPACAPAALHLPLSPASSPHSRPPA